MHIIFIEPGFPANQRHFVRALKAAGAAVSAVGERPLGWLDPELRSWLTWYEQIPNVCHEPSLLGAVRRLQGRGWIDRLEAVVEAHILPAARVREQTGIPGMSEQAALVCRDKPLMKEFLRQRGIPCAASGGVSSLAEGKDFAEAVGFPLIVKPRAGAGAAGTSRVDTLEELMAALREAGVADGASVALEEFIEGHEGFYDTLSIDSRPAAEFVSHYYPNVLPAMRTRSVNPIIVATNRVRAEGYRELFEMGRKVIAELQLGTCATHMEWFYGPRGLKFSEIGARPPGVGQWDSYNAGNDIDLYRQWAMALVHGRLDQQPSRRMSAGLVNFRPDQDGRIAGYEGLDELQRRYGEWIFESHFPAVGHPTQPVAAGYKANAWLRMRHPDYDRLKAMLHDAGQLVRVRAR